MDSHNEEVEECVKFDPSRYWNQREGATHNYMKKVVKIWKFF